MIKKTNLPEGWARSVLGDNFDVQLGKMLSEKAKAGLQLPYLANFNVRWGYFDFKKLIISQVLITCIFI
jgi:type I restriction enzyme S subunit